MYNTSNNADPKNQLIGALVNKVTNNKGNTISNAAAPNNNQEDTLISALSGAAALSKTNNTSQPSNKFNDLVNSIMGLVLKK